MTHWPPSKAHTAIALVLTAGFALRVWGIWNVDNQLEFVETMEALRVCAGKPNLNRWFKRTFCYLLAAEYGAYYGVCRVAQTCKSPMDFAQQVVRDISPLLFISRFTNVLLSTWTLWVCWRISRFTGPDTGAYWGALFAAVCPALVGLAHVGSVDTLLVLLVLITLLLALHIARGEASKRNYFLAGLFLALAMWTKTQGVLVAPCLAFAHFWRGEKGSGTFCLQGPKGASHKRCLTPFPPLISPLLLAGAGGFFTGLVLGNPTILLAPTAWVSSLLLQFKVFAGASTSVYETSVPLMVPTYFFWVAIDELGLPICILAILGVVLAVRERRIGPLIVAGGALIFAIVVGFSGRNAVRSPHQALYYLALLCILAGAGMARVRTWCTGRRRAVWKTAILVCALAFPTFKTGGIVLSFSGPTTRKQTEMWARANIPAGAKVLMDCGKRVNSVFPDLPESRENLLETMDRVENEIKERGMDIDPLGGKWDADCLTYYKVRLKTVPDKTYDITSTQLGRALQPMGYYIQNGFQYIITCSDVKDRIQGRDRREFPTSAQFYDVLDSAESPAHLLATFQADRFHRGPTFCVYALPSAANAQP